jgi:hypothetical protein
MRRARFAIVAIVALDLAAFAPRAEAAGHGASARDKCFAASLEAQTLKMKGELHAARDKFQTCARDACPKLVRHDCVDWIGKIAVAMPTIVIGAHDKHGKDVVDVRVSLDGTPLTTHLDGKPIEVDPGSHTLHFEMDGAPSVDQPLLVREGEKDRLVTVAIGPEPPPVVVAPPPPPSSGAPSMWTWIIGGVGLASLAATAVSGSISLVQWQSLHDGCAVTHSCAPGDVSTVNALYDVAYTTAAIGSALVIASVVMFFTTRHHAEVTTTVTPALGGATLAIHF